MVKDEVNAYYVSSTLLMHILRVVKLALGIRQAQAVKCRQRSHVESSSWNQILLREAWEVGR